jgi:molybdenum cofactor biosynthesis enzyme MoaA
MSDINKDANYWSQYDFTQIPYDDLVKVGQRTLLYRDLFSVSWLLGRFCNYKCSYCWPYARSDRKDHRPTELCLATIDEIKRQARDNGFNSFHFSLSGGEPTFHPGYLDILRHLADDVDNTNYTSVHMTSNMSRKLNWHQEYCDTVAKFHRASITASYHSEYANQEEFADKLLFCMEHDVQVTINMVLVPEWFDRDWDNAMYFHERGINVTLKPQSDPTASFVVKGYTDEQLAIMRNGMPQRAYTDDIQREKGKKVKRPKPRTGSMWQMDLMNGDDKNVPPIMQVEFEDSKGEKYYMDQAERFNAFNFNKFKGWECTSGFKGIIIREPDGSIKRSYSCADEPLGYVESGFKLFDAPKVCISDSCVSSADSKIPKRAPGAQVPIYPGDTSYKK